MTESTIDDGTWNGEGGHPDEGTLHAWLDGALTPAEGSTLETHVSGCEECQARVAEARGMIAGASRVVRALDLVATVGGGLTDASVGAEASASRASMTPVLAPAMAPAIAPAIAPAMAPAMAPALTPTAGGSIWRLMRVTPTRAAIAAALIVALGITLTRDRTAVPTLETASRGRTMPAAASAPAAAPAAKDMAAMLPQSDSQRSDSQMVATVAPSPLDSTLHKAITRRIAADQPPRTIEASPAASTPMLPTVSSQGSQPAQVADASAGLRVAAGRVAARAAAESAAPAPDRARTSALSFARRGAATCYRLERASPPGTPWSGGPLPMTISLTEIPAELRTNGGAGGNAESDATPGRAISLPGDDRVVGEWTRGAGDTLRVQLRGSSLTTTGRLAPNAATSGSAASAMHVGTLTASPTGGGTSTTVRVVARPVPCGR
jgi:anti-sigma factor RsiW